MFASRPVGWVSPVLVGTVFAAGLYAWLAGLGNTRPALFVAGIAALLVLDLVEWWRFPEHTPARWAAVLLAGRVALFIAVAAADGSGLSRVLFVLVPFIGYIAFGRRASVALAAVCAGALVAALALTTPRWYADAERVGDLLMFGLGLVLSVTMAGVATQERHGRVRLELAHERLRSYAGQVAELSTTAERNRLARDIHDGLGHHLTAITVLLEKASAFRDRDPDAADRAVGDARESARRALDDVRRSVGALREPFSLTAALSELVHDGHPTVTLAVTGEERGFDAAALSTLYRVAQEGVTNARRHARATRVAVTVDFTGSRACLSVADDGHGLPGGHAGSTDTINGFGLLGMRERVQLAGGQVDVLSGPTGTRITATIGETGAP